MVWHVRYFSPTLGQELLTPDLATKAVALDRAWTLAEAGEDIVAIEGPDGELVSTDEIELWFREKKQGA